MDYTFHLQSHLSVTPLNLTLNGIRTQSLKINKFYFYCNTNYYYTIKLYMLGTSPYLNTHQHCCSPCHCPIVLVVVAVVVAVVLGGVSTMHMANLAPFTRNMSCRGGGVTVSSAVNVACGAPRLLAVDGSCPVLVIFISHLQFCTAPRVA